MTDTDLLMACLTVENSKRTKNTSTWEVKDPTEGPPPAFRLKKVKPVTFSEWDGKSRLSDRQYEMVEPWKPTPAPPSTSSSERHARAEQKLEEKEAAHREKVRRAQHRRKKVRQFYEYTLLSPISVFNETTLLLKL